MRIVFINPPSPDGFTYIRDINRSGRRSREGTIWPQTSLAMLAAMFPEHEVQIWDCIAEQLDYSDVHFKLSIFRPDWVVIESVSCTFDKDMEVSRMAHEFGAKVVVISPHSEVLHEEVKAKYPFIDHLIDYEKRQSEDRPFEEPENHIRQIITGERSETRFEDLPCARQDLLPRHRYNLPLIGKGYTFVITSRGCPWTCIYCRQGVTWKNRVRYRSAEKIVEEITKYGLKNVAFHADTATVDRNRMLRICGLMPAGVRWICNSRVDTVDPELLVAMRRAGCWMVCFGIESGNDKVLQMNEKGKGATVEQARKAVRWAKEAGLQVWGYFMLGLFGDTVESMEDTVRLSLSLRVDIANFALAAPYPGTKWGQIAESNGWLNINDWAQYDQNISAVVDQPGCSHEDVLKAQKSAYRRWYFSKRGIKFFLKAYRPEYTRFFWNVAKEHLT